MVDGIPEPMAWLIGIITSVISTLSKSRINFRVIFLVILFILVPILVYLRFFIDISNHLTIHQLLHFGIFLLAFFWSLKVDNPQVYQSRIKQFQCVHEHKHLFSFILAVVFYLMYVLTEMLILLLPTLIVVIFSINILWDKLHRFGLLLEIVLINMANVILFLISLTGLTGLNLNDIPQNNLYFIGISFILFIATIIFCFLICNSLFVNSFKAVVHLKNGKIEEGTLLKMNKERIIISNGNGDKTVHIFSDNVLMIELKEQKPAAIKEAKPKQNHPSQVNESGKTSQPKQETPTRGVVSDNKKEGASDKRPEKSGKSA